MDSGYRLSKDDCGEHSFELLTLDHNATRSSLLDINLIEFLSLNIMRILVNCKRLLSVIVHSFHNTLLMVTNMVATANIN